MEEYTCPHCNKKFMRYPCRIKSGLIYCTGKCSNDARRDPDSFCTCELCGKGFTTNPAYIRRTPNNKRFCSVECNHRYKRRNFGIRTGVIGPDGYETMTDGDGKQVRAHRFVVEKHLGRKLRTDEHVHHINENKSDNRVGNLQVIHMNDHMKFHMDKYYKEYWSSIPINEILKEFHIDKMSKTSIGKRHGTSRHTILKWLREVKHGGLLYSHVDKKYRGLYVD